MTEAPSYPSAEEQKKKDAWGAALAALKKICTLPVGSPARAEAQEEHQRLVRVAQEAQLDFNRAKLKFDQAIRRAW